MNQDTAAAEHMPTALEADEAISALAAKTPNRVTLEFIQSRLTHAEFIRPESVPHMTICVLTHVNGFSAVGHSCPADPENFDEEVGKQFAFDQAARQFWGHEGFLLREMMTFQAALAEQQNAFREPAAPTEQ